MRMKYRIWHWAFNPRHDVPSENQYEPMPFDVEIGERLNAIRQTDNEEDAIRKAWCGMGIEKILNHCPKDHFNTFEYFKRTVSKIEQLED